MVLNSVEFELHTKSPKASTLKTKNEQALSLFSTHNEQCFGWMQSSSACPTFSSSPLIPAWSASCFCSLWDCWFFFTLKMWIKVMRVTTMMLKDLIKQKISFLISELKASESFYFFFFVKLPELILMSKMKTHWNRGWTCSGSVVI